MDRMKRTVVGFHLDDAADWVADLTCLHGQHVRHRPPFQQRPWVLSEEGRRSRLGAEVDCPLCDRCEPPAGLEVVRTLGPFDETSVPDGLRRTHRLREPTWGLLRLLEGAATVALDTEPPTALRLDAGMAQYLAPGLGHSVSIDGPVLLAIDLLSR
jgi:hypothetical protein